MRNCCNYCFILWAICYSFTANANGLDSIAYRYKTVNKSSKPIYTTDPDTLISTFKITYPVFQKAEWNTLAKTLIYKSQYSKANFTSLQQYLDKFIAESEEENKLTDFPREWYRNLNLSLEKQLNGTQTITFTLGDEGYTGGAHGYALLFFYNYDKKSRKLLKLTDLVEAKHLDQLHKIGERYFRKEENLGPTAPLDGYFFKNGIFRLNSNFLIEKKGITFFFNQYEIRSYAEGPMELFIPYMAIKNILKPNPYTPKNN